MTAEIKRDTYKITARWSVVLSAGVPDDGPAAFQLSNAERQELRDTLQMMNGAAMVRRELSELSPNLSAKVWVYGRGGGAGLDKDTVL
jgi:hypothetical protein